MKAFLIGAAALLAAAAPVMAQVGHPPESSPYADLEYNQEITALGGYLRARHDPAGVAPGSAGMVGVRYELSLTGPLALSSDFVSAFSQRNVLDPFAPRATRSKGTEGAAVYAADLALALNLTGRKSWHRLVPQLRAGVGLVTSRAKDDSAGFSFGTPFAFSYGGGLKLVSSGRWQLRADVTDRVFKLSYPPSYYKPAADLTAIFQDQTPTSFYTHHTALTVGVSYLFAR